MPQKFTYAEENTEKNKETTKISVILDMPEEVKQKMNDVQQKLVNHLSNVSRKYMEGDYSRAFHVTLAVAENIPVDEVEAAVAELKQLLNNAALDLKVGPIDTMTNHEDKGIVICRVDDNELKQLADKARKILESHGGQFKYDFKGHLTLTMLDSPAKEDPKTMIAEFKTPVHVGPEDVHISVSQGESWKRIAFYFSKRDRRPIYTESKLAKLAEMQRAMIRF